MQTETVTFRQAQIQDVPLVLSLPGHGHAVKGGGHRGGAALLAL